MLNLAILALSDFENWNNKESISMGGASGVIKSILSYLKADNIYLMGITSDKNNLYRKIHFEENIYILPVIYVPKGSRIPERFHAFYYSRKINSILKKYDIHSIYSHAEEILFWVKPGPSVLYHMHGATNALLKAKNKLFRNKLFQNLWAYVRKKNIQRATKIIAIDPLCYDITRKLNAEQKTILLPNFVDTSIFYRDDTPSKFLTHINEKILLFVGRMEEVKGLELFADTLIEMDRREPGNWRGVFVGRGTYDPIIRKYIKSKSSENLFHFTGAVFEPEELRKIYNKASVLMISSYFEGIPMVILECLACGTPSISTDVGGVKDILADNKMCFVNERRDPLEFADLIQSVMKNEQFSAEDFKFSSAKASILVNSILSD
jgi:glycosyltransferase involved in cell wall biosynthesis